MLSSSSIGTGLGLGGLTTVSVSRGGKLLMIAIRRFCIRITSSNISKYGCEISSGILALAAAWPARVSAWPFDRMSVSLIPVGLGRERVSASRTKGGCEQDWYTPWYEWVLRYRYWVSYLCLLYVI